jgi:hypothetical protein
VQPHGGSGTRKVDLVLDVSVIGRLQAVQMSPVPLPAQTFSGVALGNSPDASLARMAAITSATLSLTVASEYSSL